MANEFNPYKTDYSLNFEGKRVKRVKPILPVREYPDMLVGPYKVPLLTDYEKKYLKDLVNQEQATEYYQKLIEKKPSLKKHFDSFPDQEVLKNDQIKEGKTVYQVDYCKEEEVEAPQAKPETPQFPTAETVSAGTYRDMGLLKKLLGIDLTAVRCKPPPSSLDPNLKVRNILSVKTGLTEYQRLIGSVGQDIVEKGYFKKDYKKEKNK